MLKKRILAIQAAVVLGVSMLAAVTIPAGNIATVEAAIERDKNADFDSVRPYWYYKPFSSGIFVYGNENLKTGDVIKLETDGEQEPAKNYQKQISWTNPETKKKVYGVRTVNETASVTPGDFVVEYVEAYDEDGTYIATYTEDQKDEIAKYVTLKGDTVTLIGKGRFEVGFSKTFKGTVTREVTDTYEDGKTEKDSFSSAGEIHYMTGVDEMYNPIYEDGWRATGWIEVNATNAEEATSDKKVTYRDNLYFDNFPNNGSFSVNNNSSNRTILEGQTAVIVLNDYEPLETSEDISYTEYDAATDTTKEIRGTRTIKETISNKTIEWSVTDGADYISVSQKGVVKGLKEGKGKVKAELTLTRSFTVTNRWEDGVVEEYTPYKVDGEGKKQTKEEFKDYIPERTITVKAKDSATDAYNRTLRLNNVDDYEFGSFYAADDILIGKGETKPVADIWGGYIPQNTSNDPAKTSYEYYDANGVKQVITGTYTYVENVVGTKHEYVSTRENIAKVDEKGNVTGVAPGYAEILDIVTVESTFTLTYKWADGKTQTVTTGNMINETNNRVDIQVLDTDKAYENGTVYTDPVSKGNYVIYTETKTASFKAPADKNVKKYTIPATIKVNGEEYTVNAVESKAFANLNKLTYVSSKATILYMGDYVFSGAKKLSEVDMTNFRIGRIKEYTFKKSKKLKKLTVNANYLNHVDEDAFEKGVKVTVTAKGKKKSLKGDIADAFKDAGYGKFKVTFKKFKG